MAYYKQLFAGGFTGWQKVAWWWLAVFCILTYVVNWPLQFVACSPLPDYFAVGKPPGCARSDFLGASD